MRYQSNAAPSYYFGLSSNSYSGCITGIEHQDKGSVTPNNSYATQYSKYFAFSFSNITWSSEPLDTLALWRELVISGKTNSAIFSGSTVQPSSLYQFILIKI